MEGRGQKSEGGKKEVQKVRRKEGRDQMCLNSEIGMGNAENVMVLIRLESPV